MHRVPEATESRVPIGAVTLYSRSVGTGPSIIALHGGPDFDHEYLLPELDRFADAFHVIYYDQRGRGRSSQGVRPEAVTLESEVEDLDAVRQHYRLEAPVLLGHSWGAVLALHYAVRHPGRVSRLILINPSPVSTEGYRTFRNAYERKQGDALERQQAIMDSAEYREGVPKTVAARYRLHFKPALKRSEDYEEMMARMEVSFIRQGSEGILRARAVEDRLLLDTWWNPRYDLHPELPHVGVPTLVLAGDHDFIPGGVASAIAGALPHAVLTTIQDCGHFALLEKGTEVRRAIVEFIPTP